MCLLQKQVFHVKHQQFVWCYLIKQTNFASGKTQVFNKYTSCTSMKCGFQTTDGAPEQFVLQRLCHQQVSDEHEWLSEKVCV